MVDVKSKFAQEHSRISLLEDYHIHYWTRRFGVSKANLTEAVRAVGNSVWAVEDYLAKGERSNR